MEKVMKSYFMLNTMLRTTTKNESHFEGNTFFKLRNSRIVRKTMENISNHKKKLVTNQEKYANYLMKVN